MNCRRLQASPQSIARQTNRANNTSNAGQYQPMPSSRHRGPDFLGAPRAVESLAQASVLPIPTLIRRAETGSSDSIKALVKADVRPPVREVTPARMNMNAVTDTPAACYLRYTNHSQVHALWPPLTTAECAEPRGGDQPDAVRRWPDYALRLNLPNHSISGSGRSHSSPHFMPVSL